MTEKVGAILLDTRSIQSYVFGCNKLRTNTGASYLVDGIFTGAMQQTLRDSGLRLPQTAWEDSAELQMQRDASIEAEIAYIGGGNMLILVRKGAESAAVCRRLVQEWSLKVLLEAPGLKTGAAIGELNLDPQEFQQSLGALYLQLKENQNNILPQVDLPYTGLTLECDYSGKAANVFSGEYRRQVSAEVQAKTAAYAYAAAAGRDAYKDLLGEEYDFCSELESLGYKSGESYISVVHIDGNNMGVKFSSCRNMQERKELSLRVRRKVRQAFGYLISEIINDYPRYDELLDMRRLRQGSKKLLPLRPIIIGGDDITFICPGRTGMYYAQRFIEYVSSEDLLEESIYQKLKAQNNGSFSRSLSCCAGVAIVPAKYPFFRAYELAEQLCSEAKRLSRRDDGCYLDFAILHGEKYGDIGLLLAEQYTAPQGGLHYGPYNVLGAKQDKRSLKALLALTEKLSDKNMPHNKVKELRRVLHEDLHSQSIFLENCAELRRLLAEETGVEKPKAADFWQEGATRYIDAVELMDFAYLHK